MATRSSTRRIIRFYKHQTPELMPWLDAQRDQKLSVCLLIKMAQQVSGNRDLPSVLASRGNIFSSSQNSAPQETSGARPRDESSSRPRHKTYNKDSHKDHIGATGKSKKSQSNNKLDKSELYDLTGGKKW